MEEYARRKNIERFERELLDETDPERRAHLKRMIREEQARLAALLRARGGSAR